MKRQAYTMIAMIVLVGSMAVAAQAQTSGLLVVANIPFQFRVGNKTLPAGEYTVRKLNPGSDVAAVQIRSADGKNSAIVHMMTVAGKAQEGERLIFNRYGNQYYFAQAWVDLKSSGLEAQMSHAERAAQRELAGIKAKTESVALTTRR